MRHPVTTQSIVCLVLLALLSPVPNVAAQETDLVVQYGPEWESIKTSYNQITGEFQQKRFAISNNTSLSKAQQQLQLQNEYDVFMDKSRKLAVRRGEIIKICAEKHGLKVSLGSDPTKGRGMAGDIDMAGTPAQTKRFMTELKKIGIADAFDDVHCVELTPGYLTIKGPMDTTVNYNGRMGQVGSSAYDTQIKIDARSAETYLSFDMGADQPGRKAVETLDHLRKARKGLKTPPGQLLKKPEALQVACKGTFKAMETMRVTDGELKVILKRSNLDMTPDQFWETLDSVRKGHNIVPELSKLNDKNIRAFHSAMDETTHVCQNKAKQSFEIEMNRAQGLENALRQSNDPVIRRQITEVRAQKIDSAVRMHESLKSLGEMDEAGLHKRLQDAETNMAIAKHQNDPIHMKNAQTQLDNVNADLEQLGKQGKKMDDWMESIRKGTGRKPVGPSVFGETKKFRLPGADTFDDIVTRGTRKYSDFVNNPNTAKVAGYGMQTFGAGMAGYGWYSSSIAQGDSNSVAIGKGVVAALFSVTKVGSALLGAHDINHHFTVKAEQYRKDQLLHYSLQGIDANDPNSNYAKFVNRRVMLRKGVYGSVKGTSMASIFCANPVLMVVGAGLESALSIYEAREEADLWERYADQLERFNDETDESNSRYGAETAKRIAGQLKAHADNVIKIRQLFDETMKEETSITKLRQSFVPANEKYQAYLLGLVRQVQQMQDSTMQNTSGKEQTLAVLKQVSSQAKQNASHARNTAGSLGQDPAQLAAAGAVLKTLTSEYSALSSQLEQQRPYVSQATAQIQILTNAEQSPLVTLRNYQKQMLQLGAYLQPRRNSVASLMRISNKVGGLIDPIVKNINKYIDPMTRYAQFLRTRRPNERVELRTVENAIATLKGIKLPAWQTDYSDRLIAHYMNLRTIHEAVETTQGLIGSLYPEPVQSLYKSIAPQALPTCQAIPGQWTEAGQAMAAFHAELSRLHAAIGSTEPLPEESVPAEQDVATEQEQWDEGKVEEEYASARDRSSEELRAELQRLQSLQSELRKRSETAIANLNKAYFRDRDALWKAYEAAFKQPRMMACENCGTETLHSMDYSDDPPSVWCNSCGRILSFMTWAGGGNSLGQIRTVGQAKKAEIQGQLSTNLRAVDMAIRQVRDAMRGK